MLNWKPAIIDVSHYNQIQEILLSHFHLCRALLVLLAPLDLQAQVVVVMTSVMMETSIGLTSLVHHLLSDPRIMKLMLLWNLSTTRLRLFLLLKALRRTQLAHAVTWDSATQSGAVVGQDAQAKTDPSHKLTFQNQFPLHLEWKNIWLKNAKSYPIDEAFSSPNHLFSSFSSYIFCPFHVNVCPDLISHWGEERRNHLILKTAILLLLNMG